MMHFYKLLVVGLDTTGCPASGALDLDDHWSCNAGGQPFDEMCTITCQFNACNDLTVLFQIAPTVSD